MRRCDMRRFSASDTISIFEASLLWFDKDPGEQLQGYSLYGWIVLLTRDHEVHDLAHALLSEIAQGLLPAKTKSWLPHYIPVSWKERLNSPDGLDPRGTKTTISDLVKFATDRDQRPNFLAHLIPELTALPERADRSSRARQHGPSSILESGGRPPKADWDALKDALEKQIKILGYPERRNPPGWCGTKDVADWAEATFGEEVEKVSRRTIEDNVRRILHELKHPSTAKSVSR